MTDAPLLRVVDHLSRDVHPSLLTRPGRPHPLGRASDEAFRLHHDITTTVNLTEVQLGIAVEKIDERIDGAPEGLTPPSACPPMCLPGAPPGVKREETRGATAIPGTPPINHETLKSWERSGHVAHLACSLRNGITSSATASGDCACG